MLAAYGFRQDFKTYLEQLEDSKISSLEDLIQFNKDNAETELPLRMPIHWMLQGMMEWPLIVVQEIHVKIF